MGVGASRGAVGAGSRRWRGRAGGVQARAWWPRGTRGLPQRHGAVRPARPLGGDGGGRGGGEERPRWAGARAFGPRRWAGGTLARGRGMPGQVGPEWAEIGQAGCGEDFSFFFLKSLFQYK